MNHCEPPQNQPLEPVASQIAARQKESQVTGDQSLIGNHKVLYRTLRAHPSITACVRPFPCRRRGIRCEVSRTMLPSMAWNRGRPTCLRQAVTTYSLIPMVKRLTNHQRRTLIGQWSAVRNVFEEYAEKLAPDGVKTSFSTPHSSCENRGCVFPVGDTMPAPGDTKANAAGMPARFTVPSSRRPP